MQICFRTYRPLEAHVFATYLNHHEVPAHVINEASFVIGYADIDVPMAIVVPDELIDEATSLLHFALESEGLPEDIEIVYEGEIPPAAYPFEFSISGRELLQKVGFVIFAAIVLIAALVLSYFCNFHYS